MKKYPLLTFLLFSMIQGAWATRENAVLVPFYLRYANAHNEVFLLKAHTLNDIRRTVKKATKQVCEAIVALHKQDDDHALHAVAIIDRNYNRGQGWYLHNILNKNDLWNPAILQIEDPAKGPTEEAKIALRKDLLAKIDSHEIAIPDWAHSYKEQDASHYSQNPPKLGEDDIDKGLEQVFSKSEQERNLQTFIQPFLPKQESENLKADIQRLQDQLKNATKRGKIVMIIGIMVLIVSCLVLGIHKLYCQDSRRVHEALS